MQEQQSPIELDRTLDFDIYGDPEAYARERDAALERILPDPKPPTG